MFKKFMTGIIIILAVSCIGCKKSPTVYDGRYQIEEVNEYVDQVTDLKNMKIQYRTKDGDETKWFKPNTKWEDICDIAWDDNVTTWDDNVTTWDNADISTWN